MQLKNRRWAKTKKVLAKDFSCQMSDKRVSRRQPYAMWLTKKGVHRNIFENFLQIINFFSFFAEPADMMAERLLKIWFYSPRNPVLKLENAHTRTQTHTHTRETFAFGINKENLTFLSYSFQILRHATCKIKDCNAKRAKGKIEPESGDRDSTELGIWCLWFCSLVLKKLVPLTLYLLQTTVTLLLLTYYTVLYYTLYHYKKLVSGPGILK